MSLKDIIRNKKERISQIKKSNYSLKENLKSNNFTLIAEIKKASPSKGIISENFQPLNQSHQYEKGGAGALSILTEEKYFQGSKEILMKIREKTNLPLLRKDFIIDPLQVYESKLIQADVILLIASILKKEEIEHFLNIAHSIGLEAIVEVHNLAELKNVISTSAEIIGINNRNLKDFTIDLNTTPMLVDYLIKENIRNDFYIISESGIKSKNDINFLKKSKIDGVLVGETLMKADNPSDKIKEFII